MKRHCSRAAVASLVAFGAVAATSAGGAGCARTRLDRALAASRGEGKPVIVEFYAQWCGPCKRFEAEVLADPRVERALAEVELLRYDIDRPEGARLAARYGVRAVPTFLILGQNRIPVAALRGRVSTERFADFLDWGPLHGLDDEQVAARLARDPSARTLLLAARYYSRHGDLANALTYYDRALLAADLAAWRRDAVEWERTRLASVGAPVRELAERARSFVLGHPDSAYSVDALEVALLSGGLDEAERDALADTVVTRRSGDGEALAEAISVLLAAYCHDAALRGARTMVELDDSDPVAYQTLAEVHYQRGDDRAALEASDRAIALARGPLELTRFQDDRARYVSPGHADAPELAAHRDEVRETLRRLRIARLDRVHPVAPRPRGAMSRQAIKEFVAATRAFSDAARAACAEHAVAATAAIIRVDLDPRGGVPIRTHPIAGAPDALGTCLLEQVAGFEFPPPPPKLRGKLTVPVQF